jgi:hypothetical protein
VWTEADSSKGPTGITIGPHGSDVQDVARVTDSVIVMFPPLIQVAGTVSGLPFVGVATITTPAVGTVQTGSSLLQAAGS